MEVVSYYRLMVFLFFIIVMHNPEKMMIATRFRISAHERSPRGGVSLTQRLPLHIESLPAFCRVRLADERFIVIEHSSRRSAIPLKGATSKNIGNVDTRKYHNWCLLDSYPFAEKVKIHSAS